MTLRQANLITAAGLAALLAAVALTAPRWARSLRAPIALSEDEGASGDGREGDPAPAADAGRRISVRLYFPDADRQGLVPEERSILFSGDLPHQLRTVVEELVRGSTTGLLPSLAAETRVHEVFVSAGGVAYVDLSKDFHRTDVTGSNAELLTVYSVVDTLTSNFPAVKRVQILEEDRPLDTLSGHIDLSRPLLPDLTFVAVATPAPPAAPAGAP